jgi:hypothetical protein
MLRQITAEENLIPYPLLLQEKGEHPIYIKTLIKCECPNSLSWNRTTCLIFKA